VISAKAQEWMKEHDRGIHLGLIKESLEAYKESQRFASYTPEKLAELEAKYESLLAGIQAAKKESAGG
jgi:hypothetical protein